MRAVKWGLPYCHLFCQWHKVSSSWLCSWCFNVHCGFIFVLIMLRWHLVRHFAVGSEEFQISLDFVLTANKTKFMWQGWECIHRLMGAVTSNYLEASGFHFGHVLQLWNVPFCFFPWLRVCCPAFSTHSVCLHWTEGLMDKWWHVSVLICMVHCHVP